MKKFVFATILCVPLLLHANPKQSMTWRKTALCATCHGQQGHSTNPKWPHLAGQHKTYLMKQLNDMKLNKFRSSPVMQTLLMSLNTQDIDELANYYAKMPLAKGKTPQRYVKRGEQLYRGGDFTKKITACIACHGPRGTGNAPAGFPVLSGQHADYTLSQLIAFKNGQRKNDFHHIMQDISSRMSQRDMKAVAYYIQGLH